MIKTYSVKHNMNVEKQNSIKLLIKEYRKTATNISKFHWNSIFNENDFIQETPKQLINRKVKYLKNKNTKISIKGNLQNILLNPYKRFPFVSKFNKNLKLNIKSKLSARYQQTISYQVVGILDSYLQNRKNDFTKIVYKSFDNENIRISLLYINKYNLWFNNEIYMNSLLIQKDIVMIARKIIKNLFKINRFPSFEFMNMALDSKVALVKEKVLNKAKSFDYWITLSTLEKGKTIKIPIKSNDYFNSKYGILKKFCQINFVDDEIKIQLLKDIKPNKENYIPKIDSIALDFGLKNLFATNFGEFYSQNFMKKIEKYDNKITKLGKARQKQGLKTSSKRYKRLVNKFRSFLENEINRVINKIVENHSPREIIIENLDFRSPNLSKKMNRLLSNYGKRFLNNKFLDLEENLGINVIKIRPEYSSLECSSCGYVDKKNRVKQEVFKCLFCKMSMNADTNATKTIDKRSSLKLFLVDSYLKRKELLHELNKKFIETKLISMYENILKYGNNSNAKVLTKILLGNDYLKDNLDFNNILVRFKSIL